MTKTELRAAAAARRATAHAADPAAGERLAAMFHVKHFLYRGGVAAGYHPFRTEIDPRPLMRRMARAGARLALPTTPPRGSDAALAFRLLREEDVLSPSAFGVHEPPADAPLVEPDLVLVPLLAFDRTGARLGYGAGHYDRTLPELAARRAGFRAIGLAFAAQEVERLPAEPHDHPLDGIATERAYIPVRGQEAG